MSEPITTSKYAWREHGGRGLPKRSASERIADFFEIHGLFDEATAREQASRCIQCPNPTCVTGCPLCNPIPKWMQLTAEGRFLEASAVLGSLSNMPEICARVCPSDHLCEGSCILESISEPVAIQAIERFLIDYAFAHQQVDVATPPPNGFKVAVVGSGPGGLACAEELARKGYSVTIFDSDLIPGGLLINGTPAFRIDRSVVQRRIDILKQRGVVFQLGTRLWADVQLAELASKYDAVYLAMDARQARPLKVPGGNALGVIQSLPFLLQTCTALSLDAPPIEIAAKKVVVVGGGDAAVDSLRTAIRYGAREAVGIYRRGETEMPCSINEYRNAVEEGAKFEFHAAVLEVLTGVGNAAKGLRLIRTRSDVPRTTFSNGSFQVVPGTEFEIPADVVILALGSDPQPCPRNDDFGRLTLTTDGTIGVDMHQMTSWPGVFAGGDLTRGPSTVLDAVRDARRAATEIDSFVLRGRKQEAKTGS